MMARPVGGQSLALSIELPSEGWHVSRGPAVPYGSHCEYSGPPYPGGPRGGAPRGRRPIPSLSAGPAGSSPRAVVHGSDGQPRIEAIRVAKLYPACVDR
eukprot:762436-Hanusia_phi.AAC.2